MHVLILSDSHNNYNSLQKVILRHKEIDDIIFLGDGARDIERAMLEFPNKRFFAVSGNCDMMSEHPEARLEDICGHRFFLTHGHRYNVKDSLLSLFLAGKERGCQVLLYGHTHRADIEYKDGIILMNPGTLGGRNARASFGIIDISPSGIMPRILEL